jgi:hypothetical protein
MDQLVPRQPKGQHRYRGTNPSCVLPPPPQMPGPSVSTAPTTRDGLGPAAAANSGPNPSPSMNPESIPPPVPSTYLSHRDHDSGGSSTADSSMWTSISQRAKRKHNEFSPSSGSQYTKRSRPPSSAQVQQDGTDTMRDLVVVVREMQKNFASSAPENLVLPQAVQRPQPPSMAGLVQAISLLNQYTDFTSKERLAIANYLGEHENQAIIFCSLDEATRLAWLEEKRLLCGGEPRQVSMEGRADAHHNSMFVE